MNSAKRKQLTLADKQSIIKRFDERMPGTSQADFARSIDLNGSKLSKILKGREEINQSTAIKTTKKRKSENDDIDRALYLWFIEHRSQNEVINGPILKEKAEALALSLGYDQWTRSNGWFCRWKLHQIINRVLSAESNSVNPDHVKTYMSTTGISIVNRYKLSDIYNADETEMFSRLLASEHTASKGTRAMMVKKVKTG